MKYLLISSALFLVTLCSFARTSSVCSEVLLGSIKEVEKKSFYYHQLLKSEHLKARVDSNVMDDIDFDKLNELKSLLGGKSIRFESSLDERLQVIGDYKLNDIVAAPGHRQLRKKSQIEGLVKYIKSSNGGDFEHDKILLNIVVRKNGQIESLDLWNAHHRFVAYMEAGYSKISELNPKNIEILVNGKTHWGEEWGHYLSISGIDDATLPHYKVIPAGGDIREGTISVSGEHSNYFLGSRNTLGQLRDNTFKPKSLKVGVYFGTFDPIHEGHMNLIKETMEKFNLDEVVIVPNINPIHKSGITSIDDRLELITKRIIDEKGVNLYIGDSAIIIDQFGRNPFFERMTQTYGTYDLYQIIGSDSLLKLAREGSLEKSQFRTYIATQRKGEESIFQVSSDKVIISNIEDDLGISSTQIRNTIKNGEVPSPKVLHPAETKIILQKNLYK